MKFLLALFAAGAVASNLASPVEKRATPVKRDLAVVTNALASIESATLDLNKALDNFTGSDILGAIPVQQASMDLGDVTTKAKEDVQKNGPLLNREAIMLPQAVQNLQKSIKDVTDKLIEKKPQFVEAGLGSVVYSQLETQKTGAGDFSSTLIAQVPEALREVGANLAGPITDDLQKAVDAYADQAPGGASASSGSSSASTADSAAATMTTSSSAALAPTAAAGFGAAAICAMAAVAVL